MKILVIGGSYFLGKTFVQLTEDDNELYLLNRGNNPFCDDNIVEYVMDRHDAEAIAGIAEEHFDVIVDFCAYQKGDIQTLLDNLKAQVTQYIFISTCDVYKRDTHIIMTEESQLEDRYFGGEAGDYIAGKVMLESELRECCKKKNIKFTSIRPSFIYGPDNYAPRESIYFNWIISAGQIIQPYDATGEFQMVFVLDVARAIYAACLNEKAYDRAFNLCNPEMMTYESFADLMEEVLDLQFEKVELSVEEILKRQIPLPFPLTREESQWYDGGAVKQLGIEYTPISYGMKITADYFKER